MAFTLEINRLRQEVERALPVATEIRRDLHRHPELALEERRTAQVVLTRLQKLGVEALRVDETGALGLIQGGRPGPVVALRADMDALPVTEETGVPYASQHAGKMHACGHDGHTACLLGVAEVLSRLRQELPGTVKLIFQPAEEGGGGARRMVEAGVLQDPDVERIVALHSWPDLLAGQIGVRAGAMLAAVDTFQVTVRGRGGHGAHPHRCIDPILISARIIDAVQSIVSREVDPLESAVVTVGHIEGGKTRNVIPDTCFFEGTVRTLSEETRRHVQSVFMRTVNGVAAAHGATAEIAYHRELPVVINDAGVVDTLRDLGTELLGAENVAEIATPSMGGEDFSLYLEQVPGALFRLGVGPGRPALHASTFDFNDDALATGMLMLAGYVLREP
ncbi:MAG TPA: M20 family metallopeptidase [Armatimonadota bacterium]|jgi:amidohydrolase|nr:amidohydrolase [Armatimonadota bacterium]HOM82822.1 M20 family metallopeptidase [Armatimonadota bacterium]HPO74359.1 M20 family metallopeptidase [Armatimonadota bacterium]HPT97096.1 M20 family metallopeptidase [Armatimonadota bacterium]